MLIVIVNLPVKGSYPALAAVCWVRAWNPWLATVATKSPVEGLYVASVIVWPVVGTADTAIDVLNLGSEGLG